MARLAGSALQSPRFGFDMRLMLNILLVFTGAVAGSGLRYLFEGWVSLYWPIQANFISLLVINSVGCFCFACFSGVLRSQYAKNFWLTGCWGAFTSFSAVSAAFVLLTQPMVTSVIVVWCLACVLTWSLAFVLGLKLAKK